MIIVFPVFPAVGSVGEFVFKEDQQQTKDHRCGIMYRKTSTSDKENLLKNELFISQCAFFEYHKMFNEKQNISVNHKNCVKIIAVC